MESHDQALVGDKTVIFRLIDKEMYWHMMVGDTNATVTRGIALHKMIRLVTLATINGGYLNFMATSSATRSGSTSHAKATAGATSTHAASGISSTAKTCSISISTTSTTPWWNSWPASTTSRPWP